MKRYVVFIQSVSGTEWEIGEIQDCEINHNPEYLNCKSEVLYIKKFKDLQNLLMSIANNIRDTPIIIQIDAHSNPEGIAFRDVEDQSREGYADYVMWSEFNDILTHLYKTLGTCITLIFISCYSSTFAETIKAPHIPIIAAEGKIEPRRAGELLSKFYEKACTGANTEEAYISMIESFPIEEERKRDVHDRAILKLYI